MRGHGCEWSEFPSNSEGVGVTGATQSPQHALWAVLKWGLDNQCDWNELIQFARVNGCDFHQLRDWAIAFGCNEDEFSCPLAARRTNLAMLQWCREHGQSWGSTCEAECIGGD